MRQPAVRDVIHCSRSSVKKSVGVAVFLALYGPAYPALAQQLPISGAPPRDQPSDSLQEVVVTAQRRAQTLEEIPYSVTAVGADQIQQTGVTDLASLSSQVPGLSVYSFGARASNSSYPIIRGLNASAANSAGGGVNPEQSPVGLYIGNSPVSGYFQLDDVQRVEVLRGPQGTLYGAGALGGALRVIPNEPQLNSFSGKVEGSVGSIAHSSEASYTTNALVNIPIGDTLAFRVSGKYGYQSGFIDTHGLMSYSGSQFNGIPTLANASDPANSPGIYSSRKDWNDTKAFTGRSSLLWKPSDPFEAHLDFIYAKTTGDGAPLANRDFRGGSYPIDPRIQFPAGGDYTFFSASDQPFGLRTSLASLDLSYDAGFATLSSTTSYESEAGFAANDGTYLLASFPGITPYYAGNPINPRFRGPIFNSHRTHTLSQEIRLVSTAGPDKPLDYVFGLFFENQGRETNNGNSNPGTPEYTAALGCTEPYAAPGQLPQCLAVAGPGDVDFYTSNSQKFQDKSVFGELTWHFLKHGQITFGGRHFHQSFKDEVVYASYTFATILPVVPINQPASKNTWKINPSYEYAPNQHVYALWSQGFRRGGSNSVPTTGFFAESSSLVAYTPDSTNNYEAGLKGHFANGVTYAVDGFYIKWDNPQVAGSTPGGNGAVWNAKRAVSKGAEVDLSAPLLTGVSVTASAAYADARFTEDYLIKADAFGDISGKAGQQLPGSPKVSAAATLNYERVVLPGYNMMMTLNDTYRGPIPLSTFGVLGGQVAHSSGMNILNASTSITHESWRVGVYATNLTDKRVVLVPPNRPGLVGGLTSAELINMPREIGIRLGYSF